MFYNKREYSKEKERIVNVTTYNNGTRCAQAKLFHPHNRMREKTIMELDELAPIQFQSVIRIPGSSNGLSLVHAPQLPAEFRAYN